MFGYFWDSYNTLDIEELIRIEKMKDKTVYLFGAGAVIPWKGPTTSSLTELIRNTGFFCKSSNKRVTQKIYELLLNYYPDSEINFETILNVIEELLIFHSSNNYKDTNSFLFPFVKSRPFLDEIFNYEIVGEWKHGGKLIIPNQESEINKGGAVQNQSHKQFFLQLLYSNILSKISARISNYSYHTSGNTKIDTSDNEEINNHFYHWIKEEAKSESIVRLFTLNYDRLFSIVLKSNGFPIFEGADCGSELAPDDILPFDIVRITSDFESNIHYNLHGSSFWDFQVRNYFQLPSVQFFLTGVPKLACNKWEQPLMQMEKGKIINPSNIITGYQKTQKSSISPFRQMQSAFDRDCIEANKIVIVGYSFGDAHLNETIRMVLIHNSDAEIQIIDPNFRKNRLDEKLGIELFSNSSRPLLPSNISENSFSFLDGKIVVYEEYFDQFLKRITR